MKFTTPCFVRVENPQERKELTKWLKSIGYRILSNDRNPNSILTDASIGGAYLGRWSAYGKQNCGTNIPLFKALAAMNDENDREQWFRVDRSFTGRYDMVGTYELSKVDNFSATQKPETFCSKSTAEEIIEHFK